MELSKNSRLTNINRMQGPSSLRSVAHAAVILKNGNLQSNMSITQNDLMYLDYVNYILLYINIAV